MPSLGKAVEHPDLKGEPCFFCAESISKEGVPSTLEMRPKVANDQYCN